MDRLSILQSEQKRLQTVDKKYASDVERTPRGRSAIYERRRAEKYPVGQSRDEEDELERLYSSYKDKEAELKTAAEDYLRAAEGERQRMLERYTPEEIAEYDTNRGGAERTGYDSRANQHLALLTSKNCEIAVLHALGRAKHLLGDESSRHPGQKDETLATWHKTTRDLHYRHCEIAIEKAMEVVRLNLHHQEQIREDSPSMSKQKNGSRGTRRSKSAGPSPTARVTKDGDPQGESPSRSSTSVTGLSATQSRLQQDTGSGRGRKESLEGERHDGRYSGAIGPRGPYPQEPHGQNLRRSEKARGSAAGPDPRQPRKAAQNPEGKRPGMPPK